MLPGIIVLNRKKAMCQFWSNRAKKFNYHADWLERKSDNPYLFFLGEKAVNWLLYGTPFSVDAFKAVILETMKDSGIPRDTLSLRLDALDASIEGRYSRCYELL